MTKLIYKQNFNNVSIGKELPGAQKNHETVETSQKDFLFNGAVKKCKSEGLKNRLRALILDRHKSEADFFNSLGISRQYWYMISWGLGECPTDLKIKISAALGTDSRTIWESLD